MTRRRVPVGAWLFTDEKVVVDRPSRNESRTLEA